MLKYGILVLFLSGITLSSGRPQKDAAEAREEITNDSFRIKKDELGANDSENAAARNEEILKNFRNPILEYLMNRNAIRSEYPERKGIIRELKHSQTLLIPNGNNVLTNALLNPIGSFQTNKPNDDKDGPRNPDLSPLENFLNYVKSRQQETTTRKSEESFVTSPVLHLNKNQTRDASLDEVTKVQVYPALAVLINTFGKDGTLKNSVTHIQPDFTSLRNNSEDANGAGNWLILNETVNMEKYQNQVQKMHYSHHINNISSDTRSKWFITNEEKTKFEIDQATHQQHQQQLMTGQQPKQQQRQPVLTRQSGLTWPFAQYFPIVINDPFLTAYNAFTSGMYNTFSSMIEYGPEADICRSKGHSPSDHTTQRTDTDFDEVNVNAQVKLRQPQTTEGQNGFTTENLMDKIDIRRRRRDVTNIFVKAKNDEMVGIKVKEPNARSGISLNYPDVEDRSRSHSVMLVNPPPLSTILRPPNKTGLGIEKRKKPAKPGKPIKEENQESSEEVGEEQEEETSSQEGTSDGVAISPPPEGASVAEAKPVGLAIAGPGGVASAKPQGTAVAGPGGLAIARPVGTAIAGVDVEGSIPIGAQQHKNNKKKKPKQEPEMDTELQYVGGLQGPIGNPQPKQFADNAYFGGLKGNIGNPVPSNMDELYFRGRYQPSGYQFKLGQHNGKYGFVPMLMTPVRGTDRLQKRMDSPTFFHGLLGNKHNEPQHHNPNMYPVMYY